MQELWTFSILEDSAPVYMPKCTFKSLGPCSLPLSNIHLIDIRQEHIEENTRTQETNKTIIMKATEVINKSERRKQNKKKTTSFLS